MKILNKHIDRFKDWFVWKFQNPYKLNYPSGQCPVQIEGILKDGLFYYFRARGHKWSFGLWKNESDYFDNLNFSSNRLFQYVEDYGTTFEAGWMTKEEAIKFATKALDKYYGQRYIYN